MAPPSASVSPRSSVSNGDDGAGSSSEEAAAAEDTERDCRDPLYNIHLNEAVGLAPKIEIGSGNSSTTVRRRLKKLPPNVEGGPQMDSFPYPKPVLMVDLSSISGFSPLPNRVACEIVQALNERLYEAFDERSETLFEMGAAIHATEDEVANLIHIPGIRHDTVIPYPPNYEKLDDMWGSVCAPSDICCVEALLVPLRCCSRPLEWKAAMREEIEMLAIREAQRFDEELITEWQESRRRQELKNLVAARPVFVEQVAIEEQRAKNGAHEAQAAAEGLRHKIDQIDNLVAELELCEIEDGGEALGSDEDEPTSKSDMIENLPQSKQQLETKKIERENDEKYLTTIDAVLAMVLGRIPPKPGDEPEKHTKMLLNWHYEIRTKWKEEFGKLPSTSCLPPET